MIIIWAFDLWQSVILKPKVITNTATYTEICYKIGSYEVTHLSYPGIEDIQPSQFNK